MEDSELCAYLVDIAERLEVLSNVLRFSTAVVSNARYNQPANLKRMLDSIICDELAVMAGEIIDDINE